MEIETPQEFIERQVIDIDVEFIGAPPAHWTINERTDGPSYVLGMDNITFDIPETGQKIAINRRNIAWTSIMKRVDRIPVPKPKPAPVVAPTA